MADSFFVNPSKRSGAKRRAAAGAPPPRKTAKRTPRATPAAAPDDDEITSGSDASIDSAADADDVEASESESDDGLTEADRRREAAKRYLDEVRGDAAVVEGFDAKDLDDDIIGSRLRNDAAEKQSTIYLELGGYAAVELRKSRSAARHLTAIAAAHTNAYVGAKDGSVERWDVAALKPRLAKRRPAQFGPVLAIAVNTADRLVVTGHASLFVLWNAQSLEVLRTFKVHGDVLSVAFRRNSSDLYVGSSDLRLRTYNMDSHAFIETLHGHQDAIVGISALALEQCVTVGARDRSAIFWKIPEESRLAFRGGDTKLAAKLDSLPAADARALTLEGSLDCCAMLDSRLFVTGSDNGNVCLWTTQRKKPQFVVAQGHGLDAPLPPSRASAETDPTVAEIPPAQPRYITAVAAVPFSNTFFTGSWSGTVNMWTLSADLRSFKLVREVPVGKGIVTGLAVASVGRDEYAVVATLSREPRLGRWLKMKGHDAVAAFRVRPAEAQAAEAPGPIGAVQVAALAN